jgi:hypothetical protein
MKIDWKDIFKDVLIILVVVYFVMNVAFLRNIFASKFTHS